MATTLCALILVPAFAARGATLNVPADHATIQACIDAAVSGVDECVVAPGTYNELIDFNGKAMTLRSSGGAAVTIIDGTGLGFQVVVVRCVSGEGPDTVLDGFTITEGNRGMHIVSGSPTVLDCVFSNNGPSGTGMHLQGNSNPTVLRCLFVGNNGNSFWAGGMTIGIGSSATLRYCTFRGNYGILFGGAVSCNGGSLVVDHCMFDNNLCELGIGGGLLNGGSDVIVSHSSFVGNRSGSTGGGDFGGGGIHSGGNLTVTNCRFSGNVGSHFGGAVQIQDGDVIINNGTFAGNDAGVNGGGIYNIQGNVTVSNCALQGNTPDQIFDADPGTGDVTVRYSVLQGGFGPGVIDGGGNVNADPLFVDTDGADNTVGTIDDDLRLLSGSPAIDAGDDTAVTLDAVDADGDLDTSERTPVDLADMPRFCDDPAEANTGVADPGPPVINNIVDMGAHEFRRAVFVNDDATGTSDGSSWADAHDTLQNGLTDAARFDDPVEAWVAAGTYRPDQGTNQTPGDRSATFQLLNGVGLYGGFAGSEGSRDARDWTVNEAILTGDLTGDDGPSFANNGENSYHVVTGSGTDATALLDGFTITGGNANGAPPDEAGGAMRLMNGSPMIRNATVRSNSAAINAGAVVMLGGSAPSVRSSSFIGNKAGAHAGAVDCRDTADPSFVDCNFVNNSADSAGAVQNAGTSPSYFNCRFLGNNAARNGGGMFNGFGAEPWVTNCVFSGNVAADYRGGGMFNEDSSNPILTNCTLYANAAQTGNGSGGGMYSETNCAPIVNNSVFWENSDSGGMDLSGQIHDDATSTSEVNYSVVQGTWAGAGGNNIDSDPLFLDANGVDNMTGTTDDDLRPGMGSPCFDAGDNAAVPMDVADLDGDADTAERVPLDLDGSSRFADMPGVADTGVADPPDYPAVVDMGAYERSPCLSADDCADCDVCTQDACVADFCQYAPRKFGDVNNDGTVDIFDILCVLDGFVGTFNPPCTLTNLDLTPCSCPDGLIDIFDILAVLDGFSGVNACACPAGP